MPNPLRYIPVEALPSRTAISLPQSLQIGGVMYYKSLVIRLLTGTLSFRCVITNDEIIQNSDYSTLTHTPNVRASKRLIEKAVSCKIPALDRHIKSTNNQNREFYQELFHEYCCYFHQANQGNSLNAFVHVYRILERIAYCFPLLWAARAKRYEQTFKQLKGYFNDPKIGELGVFKRFIQDSVDENFRHTQVTLRIESAHPLWQKSYYEAISKSLSQSNKANYIVSESQYSAMTIHFEGLIDLVVTTRNRYFHALTGAANSFDSHQLPDANEFFLILNEAAINWFSFILFQVLEYEMK